MLKAAILENQRTLDLVLEKYRDSCILSDMGHDSLQVVTSYPRSAWNDLHAKGEKF